MNRFVRVQLDRVLADGRWAAELLQAEESD